MYPRPRLDWGKRVEVRQLFITRLLHFSCRGSQGCALDHLVLLAGSWRAPCEQTTDISPLDKLRRRRPPMPFDKKFAHMALNGRVRNNACCGG